MSDSTPREHRIAVTRAARCFTLGGEAAAEAWVVVHGYGQLAARFLRNVEALATPTRLVVAPEGLSRFYLDAGAGKVGASWMTREDREQEIADYLAYLDQVRARLVPPVPLTVLGFSQGVATAARWAVNAAPAPVRLVAWGSLLPEEISAGQLAPIRVSYVVGEQETWAPPAAVEAQASALGGAGVRVDVVRFDGGHEIRPEVLTRLT
jgi:predicted esterase